MLSNDSSTGVDSYFLTDAQFNTVIASGEPSSVSQPTNQYVGITTFKTSGNDATYNYWYGQKIQPWPAAAWSEMYRFEKGDKARGYIFNKLGGTILKNMWLDEVKSLLGSVSGMSTISAVAATIAFTTTLF